MKLFENLPTEYGNINKYFKRTKVIVIEKETERTECNIGKINRLSHNIGFGNT